MRLSLLTRSFFALALTLIVSLPSTGLAQTGVSDDRVSLPGGPGSVDGFSDNADVNPNMGLMTYQIPLDLPLGHAEATPSLSLLYSSGTGNTALGMGWELATPYLERTTLRGLPRYDASDSFAANGGEPLLEVAGGTAPTYRARFERSFVRYRWQARGDGTEGYWTAEYPDGSVGYFGASASGKLAPEARSSFADRAGTFRYHLYEKVDRFGHVVRYRYAKSTTVADASPLLRSVEYGFEGTTPRYKVLLSYEDRDDLISDCKAGFCESIGNRLAFVDVLVADTAIRRYALSYEQAGTGGLSRLLRVERQGLAGLAFPAVFTFKYSRALGEQCMGCEQPYLVRMSEQGLGADIGERYATLVDINGDALPDLVDTRNGAHRFFVNQLSADGTQRFAAPRSSKLAGITGFELSNPNTQILDVNGDGFADLLNRISQQYLVNEGGGDWARIAQVAAGDESPDFSADFEPGDAQLAHVRFLDYDNDKSIDIIRSLDVGGVTMFRNLGGGRFQVDANAEDIGYGFDAGNLQLSDMNGDGLLDPVRILENRVEYRLNLGYAQWGEWQGVDLDIATSEIPFVELEDLNGDELSDIIVVQNDVLRFSINRNGASFDAWRTLTEVGSAALPTRGPTTSVLYADMNGNGSTDVVWADGNGLVTYLELFPARPNLLTEIRNGLGAVTEVTYGASVQHLARSAEPWRYKLGHAMVVVDALDTWDELSQNHEVTRFDYSDGFYDGKERRFRGFAHVVKSLEEDADQEAAISELAYDVGAEDPYRAGLMLAQADAAVRNGKAVPMQSQVMGYDDCPVAEADALGEDEVRHVCETSRTTTLQEGAKAAEWQTLSSEQSYDGYGQVTLSSELGVIGTGPDSQGDESYVETTFIAPGTATGELWILGRASRERRYGVKDSKTFAQTDTFYDGKAFVGLGAGKLTRGLATRVVDLRDADGASVQTSRERFDAHGNIVESLDPNASVDGYSHRRLWTYDPTGLRVIQTEIQLEDAEAGRYSLRREYRYDTVWDKPVEATSWMAVRGGKVESARDSEYYGYDDFGRTAWRVLLGGDTPEAPTEVYSYELDSPVSRVRVQSRSKVGAALDLEAVRCIDGLGREVQRRTRLQADRYQVTGFSLFNKRGERTRVYQPYESTSGACDETAPTDVLYSAYRYDGLARPIESIAPDGAIYGSASRTRTVYGPLSTTEYDAEDNDTKSSASDTPLVQRVDGLGRIVALERQLKAGGGKGASGSVRLRYDELGRIATVEDPGGNLKQHRYDLLGRVLEVDAPNAGSVSIEYDDAGNVVRRRDGRGEEVMSSYDGVNRLSARWNPKAKQDSLMSWTYDLADNCSDCKNPEGQLASVRYPLGNGRGTGIDEFGYDVRGNITREARTLQGHTFAIQYAYDNASRRVKTTYPDGTELRQVFDAAARVLAVPDFVDSARYDTRGLLAEHALANGTRVQRSYDEQQRLRSLSTLDADGSVLQGFEYAYDRVGNVSRVRDLSERMGRRATADATLRYDAYYRLIEYTMGADSDAVETVKLAYDLIDNLTSKTSSLGEKSRTHVGTLAYDGNLPNAVVSAGKVDYEYDDAGMMTRRGGTELSWDYQGHLVEATRADGVLTEIAYSATGRALKLDSTGLTFYVGADFEIRDGVSTTYVRLGQERVARRSSAALMTEVMPDLAPSDKPDGKINAADAYAAIQADRADVGQYLQASARRMLLEADGPDTFLHDDHLGSLTLATDAAGEVRGERLFYATGEVRSEEGFVDPHGFTGQEQDADTELTHFQFRYLDSEVGRWVSPDPLFLVAAADSIGRLGESSTDYAYVANNFFNAVDPTGLSIGEKLSAAKAAVGRGLRAAGSRIKQALTSQRARGIGRALGTLAKSTLAGAAQGAVVGAATGAIAGGAVGASAFVVGAIPGALSGAAAGAVGGAIIGGIGGFIGGLVKVAFNQTDLGQRAARAIARPHDTLTTRQKVGLVLGGALVTIAAAAMDPTTGAAFATTATVLVAANMGIHAAADAQNQQH